MLPLNYPPNAGYNPVDEKATPESLEVDMIQTPHYWVALLIYLVLSGVLVCSVVYKYRTVWRIKTVITILCIVFLIFVLSQLMVFIWE